MSETIKTSGEKSAENVEVASHLEVLTEMGGKFDPNKAESLAERDKPRSVEKPKTGDKSSGHLAVMPEKREKELSPRDAANEYLSLLDELSQDFSNPYYSDERKGEHHYANNITTELGREYSDNPHYRWQGHAGTEAGETDGTMLRIASADNIIANEIDWRDEGQKIGDKLEKLRKKLSNLDDKYAARSRLGKLFGKRKYQKERRQLQSQETTITYSTRGYNAGIAKELAISYNESGNYDYDPENQDFGERKNEERNRRFFGLDNPERAKKVERAIELRRKYAAEWSKKK